MSITNEKQGKSALKHILGWLGVVIVTAIAGFWAYWGGVENFHEGWYAGSFFENLFMMFIQYWLLTVVFVGIGLMGLKFKKTTLVLCILLAIGAGWLFRSAHYSVLLLILPPFIAIGLLFNFGEAKPKWLAKLVVMAVPALILIITTVWGVVMVGSRIDDGDYGARVVEGNGVCLVWAPEGPGWPENSATYGEAKYICAHLSEDGTEILDEEVNIWRLPTVPEAVACMMRHGENAGGVWDEQSEKASYDMTPDKETPLWKVHSPIIYYWTDTMADEDMAYIIVYHGGVFSRHIDKNGNGSTSFRAVKDCN